MAVMPSPTMTGVLGIILITFAETPAISSIALMLMPAAIDIMILSGVYTGAICSITDATVSGLTPIIMMSQAFASSAALPQVLTPSSRASASVFDTVLL